jgi:hypothetical protein
MLRRGLVWTMVLGAFLACTHSVCGQTQNGLYRIVSGDYIEYGGFIGALRYRLPTEFQAYVRLTVGQDGLATLTFLREDMRTTWRFRPCPDGPPMDFGFAGVVFSDRIVFQAPAGTCAITGGYMVTTNGPGRLRIGGDIESDPGLWVDFPHRFDLVNVVAVLMPDAAIRVSEFEICWLAASNTTYQVHYRNELTTNVWTNLGGPHTGDGTTNCVTDKVPAGQPRRFYRVLPVP